MSTAAIPAQGTTLHIAGSAAAAEVLTAIVVGFPTILAITGHAGVANGDVVTLAGFTGADAATLNGLSFVVKNYATGGTNDTFAIDVNTVGKTITIDAGNTTATPTAWIKVGELKSIKPSSAQSTKIDVTDLDSTAKEYRTGLPDNGTCSLEFNSLDSDVGQAAMQAAFDGLLSKNFKITYPSGSTPVRTFEASITSFSTIADASVDGTLTGSADLQISGAITKS